MKYLRNWDLPTLDDPVCEHLEKIEDWGQSYFWYCAKCRSIYASVILHPEDCSNRIWMGLRGLCMTCPPNKWTIRGEIEGAPMEESTVPLEVRQYQLDREIDFLCHPNHPRNINNGV